MLITLDKPHTHRGKREAAGKTIDVTAPEAAFLIAGDIGHEAPAQEVSTTPEPKARSKEKTQ